MSLGRLIGWLGTTRYIERRLALLALLMSLPCLGNGFSADDFDLRDQLETLGPFEAYHFTSCDPARARAAQLRDMQLGLAPWWTDPESRQCLFRPLASSSLWLDFRLWPRAPWLMLLENCLLYAAIVLGVGLMYRRLGLSGVALGLATFFYALNAPHAMSVGWISARNTLLATCFAVLTWLMHERGVTAMSTRARWTARFVAWLAFAASISSAEFGLSALAYVVSYALWLDPRPVARRVGRLVPYALLTLAWAVVYVRGGYGAVRLAFYHDVIGDPFGSLLRLAYSIPVYVASQIAFPFATLHALSARGPWLVALLALIVLALTWRLFAAPLLRDPTARFLLGGAAFSVAQLVATVPQDCIAWFVGIGVTGLLAQVLADRQGPPTEATPAHSRGTLALLRVHALWLPLLFLPHLFAGLTRGFGGGARALDRALPHGTQPTVVLFNSPTQHVPRYVFRKRAHDGVSQPAVFTLYAGASQSVVRRLDDHRIELHVAGGWLANKLEQTRDLQRAPFRVGDVVALPRFFASVLEVNAKGCTTRVQFRFAQALDGGAYAFYCWRGRKPERCQLLSPGEQLVLDPVSAI